MTIKIAQRSPLFLDIKYARIAHQGVLIKIILQEDRLQDPLGVRDQTLFRALHPIHKVSQLNQRKKTHTKKK